MGPLRWPLGSVLAVASQRLNCGAATAPRAVALTHATPRSAHAHTRNATRNAGDGSFALPVESIRAVSTAPSAAPKWVHISSAGVTRPNRPGIDVNAEPPAVRLNDALGGLLTYKLKGEEALMGSGVPFAIIRPVALTEARAPRCDAACWACALRPASGCPACLASAPTFVPPRPGARLQEPVGAPLEVDQGDTIKGKISREEIADLTAFCLSVRCAVHARALLCASA